MATIHRPGDPHFMPVSFSFEVTFPGQRSGVDGSFQEVSGLDVRMETEDVHSGGENRYVYKLPKGVQQDKLVLKRGVADSRSPLMTWCKATLEGGLALPVLPRDVCVYLLDEQGHRLRGWTFSNAFPVRWSVDEFNSTKNNVAIETIELAYLQCSRGM
ncbi:phage tail protein [Paludibacterium purpuratum]|uniref:Phage tail-like protein n=1 Tax=Paludibacterium purpuratum TaxID=1144873 RepID=A0A4R7BCH8_9NEIS|nr:phage tail protein [Paludibacterium purpuratum]TDR82770.1 phage tail-like protein [Paludibacterium purpuratum]